MTNRIWILGASDPEMAAIESLLRECGETVVHAMIGGRRVTPGEAYRADCPQELTGGCGEPLGLVCRVECEWDHSYESLACPMVTIDHHRPGDPGYGVFPQDYLKGASIGQVITVLAQCGALSHWDQAPFMASQYTTGTFFVDHHQGDCVSPRVTFVATSEPYPGFEEFVVNRMVPDHLLYTAAADHCLAHAYAGRCPGVDPDALLRHRVAQQVAFRACPVCGGTGGATGCGGESGYEGPCHAGPRMAVDSVLAEIEAAHQALLFAPELELAGHQCEWHAAGHRMADDCQVASGTEYSGDPCWWIHARDMRGMHVPSLPDAGTRYGIPYVADGLPGPDGRTKIVCSGPADVVKAFLQWAPRHGLVDSYGDPERGFAGAYS